MYISTCLIDNISRALLLVGGAGALQTCGEGYSITTLVNITLLNLVDIEVFPSMRIKRPTGVISGGHVLRRYSRPGRWLRLGRRIGIL